MIDRLFRMLIAALVLLLAGPAPALAEDGVAAIRSAHLPPLKDDGSMPTLLTVEGRPLLLQRSTAYLLAPDARGWKAVSREWLPEGAMIGGAVSDGTSGVILLGSDEGVDRAAVITVEGGALKGRMLPRLPVALQGARAAIQAEELVLAGAADGAVRLFRTPLTGAERWTEQTAWPGGDAVALVGQGAGLFATLADGSQWRWTSKTGWQERTRAPGAVVPASGRAVSQAGLLFLF